MLQRSLQDEGAAQAVQVELARMQPASSADGRKARVPTLEELLAVAAVQERNYMSGFAEDMYQADSGPRNRHQVCLKTAATSADEACGGARGATPLQLAVRVTAGRRVAACASIQELPALGRRGNVGLELLPGPERTWVRCRVVPQQQALELEHLCQQHAEGAGPRLGVAARVVADEEGLGAQGDGREGGEGLDGGDQLHGRRGWGRGGRQGSVWWQNEWSAAWREEGGRGRQGAASVWWQTE